MSKTVDLTAIKASDIAYKEPKHKAGRPTKYTLELTSQICRYLAQGMSLRRTCEQPGMPHMDTIFTWLQKYPDFNDQYARAKQEAADAMAEEILDIADDGTNDWMEDNYLEGKTPGWHLNGENIQRSKLRVDTRRWLMAKMKPKRYGDKLDMTTNGRDLPTPLLATINIGELNVRRDDSPTQALEAEAADQGGSGGNLGLQDHFDPTDPD